MSRRQVEYIKRTGRVTLDKCMLGLVTEEVEQKICKFP